jgi:hypothetical protein
MTQHAQAQIGDSQKISNTQGELGETLENDSFGAAIAELGDLNGDGKKEVAVGVPGEGTGQGAVWILSLNTDGTVSSLQKISDTQGGFGGSLDEGDAFGQVRNAGDIDGDGITDLAVGATGDDDGGTEEGSDGADRGAVWILFLNSDGTVSGHQKISDTQGGFEGTLDNNDEFGTVPAPMGDLNGDSVPDLAVSALFDDDGGTGSDANHGAVWILFLNSDGTVSSHQKISDTQGGFDADLVDDDFFGGSARVGDVDGDGVTDLAVGARDDDGGLDRGAVWILFLNSDGTVSGHQKISDTQGGFTGTLDDNDAFFVPGRMGDLDGNGVPDLAVGAFLDDDGGSGSDANRGAVWILYLQSDGTVANQKKISDTQGGFTGTLSDGDRFGLPPASIGDLNGDGIPDLAVGANEDDDGNDGAGATWILFGDQAILPVEFARFEAQVSDGDVRLTWQTASETNNAEFQVQRRMGERANVRKGAWTTVGSVEGSGTTSQPQSYRFTDADLPYAADALTYRLRQVDTDGTAHLSETITVERGVTEAQLLGTYPNPAQQRATVRYALPEKQKTSIRLYDVLGRQVRTVLNDEQEGRHQRTLDVGGLPSGVYFLRLRAGGVTRTQKLTVVR